MADLCHAVTAKGKPCRNRPMNDRDVCKAHSGDANVGRRGALTPELIERISDLIGKGVPARYACEACGIHEATFYRWREHGEAAIEHDDDTLEREFCESIARARASFLSAHAMNVSKHATGYSERGKVKSGDWKASAWLLERRGGEEWRERVGVDHAGTVRTEPVEIPETDDRLTEVGGILAEIGVVDEGAS